MAAAKYGSVCAQGAPGIGLESCPWVCDAPWLLLLCLRFGCCMFPLLLRSLFIHTVAMF